ncbi:ATP-grasp domain-containing protein [Rhizobium alvei]|uniref:ATP-grasp domain-containing protein n=1 Tax=Rhizobium alvei TaxID=1132659 RepID=A0ABT8YR58_9HYPH|nr:ATP-grasp domain-containing protein [Rhizobium alvei]MDO6965797.1 ATP-grasp domain-containing protein [Rhizobium alvei]
MTVQWLLQGNHPHLSSIREIEQILRDQGNDVAVVALKGNSTDIPLPETLDLSRPTVCYGPSFVPRALEYPRLSPGIFFDPATFRWSAFRDGWGDRMLSADALVANLPEAMARIASECAFVRPDEDSKAFDGGPYDRKTLTAALDPAISKGRINDRTQIIIARPIQVDAEWRTFIVGGEVVAASSYRYNGIGNMNLHVPHRAIDLAFEAAELWVPADVFCLDIALSGERYGIVEANCFNAARFYGADAGVILESVASFVDRKYTAANDARLTTL